MRYLVTGCAGFIASKVCNMLLDEGHSIVGFDSLNDAYDVRLKYWRLAHLLEIPLTDKTNFRLSIGFQEQLSREDQRFIFVKGDTASKSDVERVFKLGPYDAVLNLAALAGVQASMENPLAFLKANTEGVVNVLEAMRTHCVNNHVVASSSSVYAPAPGVEPKRSQETDSTEHPKSVYAVSKKAAELICHSYAVRDDKPVYTTVVRYFTVYGPAGRPDMSIFRFIESALRGSEIAVTGDGNQSRDFTFVDDIALGTILATKSNKGFRIINLGGGKSPTKINQLIGIIESNTERKLKRLKAPPAVADIAVSMADVGKAKKELNWEPRVGIEEGIRRTVAWHKKNRAFASLIDLPGVAPVISKETIGVIGLGYVGLPLANSLSRYFKTIGFDINEKRVKELNQGIDRTNEISRNELVKNIRTRLKITNNEQNLKKCSIIIVTVPTPVDASKLPDLRPVKSASATIGKVLKYMKKSVIVVYESTVYPGCTEEDCVPVIEKFSGLKCGRDFHIGYSPERINPGDKQHTLDKITKVIAGDNPETVSRMMAVYSRISKDVYIAESIKVAEAAKVIENTQRDLNIALVNELLVIFEKLGIKTSQVLRAAGTKWNFLNFKPGLVGGHCIGVDPYYLTNRAQRAGYHPEIILAGRKLNDGMPKLFADYLVKQCFRQGYRLSNKGVLILGLSFKENIPDFRNSKSVDLIRELESYGIKVSAYDPHIDATSFANDHENAGISVINKEPSDLSGYDAIVLAVSHNEFLEKSLIDKLLRAKKAGAKIFDLKNLWQNYTDLSDWSP